MSDEIDFDAQVVHCDGRQKRAQRLAALLHEAGRLLIWKSRKAGKRVAGRTLQTWLKCCGLHMSCSLSKRFDVRWEEMEAWKRGEALGKRIGATSALLESIYGRHRTRCVATYVRWAAT